MKHKYLCLADLHLREDKPDCRLESEDWMQTVDAKLQYLIGVAKEQKIDAVLLAGDVFDTWKVSSRDISRPAAVRDNSVEFVNYCAERLAQLKEATTEKRIYAIHGNHDCPNHDYAQIKRSAYSILAGAGVLYDLANPANASSIFGVYLFKDSGMYTEAQPIILAHKGLYLKEKPWPGAPDDGNVGSFVKDCIPASCRLLVAGDYHQPFATRVGKCAVVNCGSILRLKADQIDYAPRVTVIEIDEKEVKAAHFSIPVTAKIRRDHIDVPAEQKAELEELVGGVDGDFEITMNFRENFYGLTANLENRDQLNQIFERTMGK